MMSDNAVPDSLRQLAADLSLGEAMTESVAALVQRATSSQPALAFQDLLPERYRVLGRLGRGGMGEVWQVHDAKLGRAVAMKVLPGLSSRDKVEAFVAEAMVTAQLSHPGIVPLHEMGELADGSLYYTMKQVVGRPLSALIIALHDSSPPSSWGTTADTWTLRRLIDVFARACEAIAHAHQVGVLHRDLKPENVMVGEHSEVQVVDWGLSKLLAVDEDTPSSESLTPITLPESDDSRTTQDGEIKGTMSYMAPEQALGHADQLDARTDVYGLGAVLYEILTARPPVEGPNALTVLMNVVEGRIPPLVTVTSRPLPPELVEITVKSLSREPASRYSDAGALAAAVRGWLDGAAAARRAERLVSEAHTRSLRAAELEERAAVTRRSGEIATRQSTMDAALTEGWELLDRADDLESEARSLRVDAEMLLQSAVQTAPDSDEARRALLEFQLSLHARAERSGDHHTRIRLDLAARGHVEALPGDDVVRKRAERYLDGTGAFSLTTTPPATGRICRLASRARRLVVDTTEEAGGAPWHHAPLDMGSWLLELSAPGRACATYPISITRNEHWRSLDPDGVEVAVRLLEPDQLADDGCYVPPGWFQYGGDPRAFGSFNGGRAWVDGFVIMADPVTHAQYLEFLNDLVRRGDTAAVIRHMPRPDAGDCYAANDEGVWGLSAVGLYRPDCPVVFVTVADALAYAEWLQRRTGFPWRLPGSLEFEKAARGVDGRAFVWGDWFDPTRCNSQLSGISRPAPVSAYPLDKSVYGVRGLAGNVSEPCHDAYDASGPVVTNGRYRLVAARPGQPRVLKGGDSNSRARVARAASTRLCTDGLRTGFIGFRLAYSVDADTERAARNEIV